ncbi:MAG: hypothetical protein M1836_000812 [Candelina mexicana]|nr:MAG: hypothetical protein M1836_000812 [Candelina mexicana]
MAFTMVSVCLSALFVLSAVNASPLPVDDTLLEVNNNTITITERDGNVANVGNVGGVEKLTTVGFTGCKGNKKDQLQEAFNDAMILVKGMGDPEDINFISKMVKDYFGSEARDEAQQKIIKGNFKRAQAANTARDNIFGRYLLIHCDDPGDQYGATCKKSGAGAYMVDKGDSKLKNQFPVINFCDKFFTYESLADRIDKVNKNPETYHRDNVKSLLSRVTDREISSRTGKAYGPERAKFIARMDTLYAVRNVDNFVYFAIAEYMYHKWGILPYNPPYKWSAGKKSGKRDDTDDVVVDDVPDGDKPDADKPLKTEAQIYGTTEPLECVGTPDNQPSTTQDWALQKIKTFCKYVAGGTITSTADYIPGGYRAGHDQPWWGNDMWVSISWNPECPGKELKVKQDDCERLLGRTIKDCKDSPQKKYGGTVFGECGVYDLMVRNGNDVTPPKGNLLSLMMGNPNPGWDGNV